MAEWAVRFNRVRITSVSKLAGSVRPPSDKSVTHRALIFGAMASGGPSAVFNPLHSEDTLATASVLEELGCEVEWFPAESDDGRPFAIVQPATWTSPDLPLDCGNSGTTMRLIAGAIARVPGLEATLTGDASLSRRPMGRVAKPLALMGAEIAGESPPLRVRGAQLRGIDYTSDVASAQVKSAILIAGLGASGETWVTEPAQSRDHTERFFDFLGIELMKVSDNRTGVRGGQKFGPFETEIPADISSAAFILVAAALTGDGVTLRDIGTNPSRTGILDVLASTGVEVEVDRPRDAGAEPLADLTVSRAARLAPFEVAGPLVPRLIDEIPVLAVLATQCEGTSTFRDASELRVKESDRLSAMALGLSAMGADVQETFDGLVVRGPTLLTGANIDATGDHRLGMAFSIAGLIAQGETVIDGASSVLSSYPGFFDDLSSLGAEVTCQ